MLKKHKSYRKQINNKSYKQNMRGEQRKLTRCKMPVINMTKHQKT